ncbi:MAG: ABC transporter ATP-binding protein [Myxococcales bacterium]|nr:ABC transporter ATP-binding protein [Myxococcales bacterium]HRC56640.1 ABC transporter ATP-binding protein [Kofleriaceae bacterium]
MSALAIEVRGLEKTYRTPFRRRKVEALRGVSFSVERGRVFGFLGPNGAGKTTTIRVLMGLIRPSAGSCRIMGHDLPSQVARSRVGFLPEQPYFYDYLTVSELLDLAGRLFGLDRATRRRRADELIAKVGLDRARSQSLKKYSKGMLQRAGLAQALMNDPDVVVLDEPTSGLDPVGRKEVRELILELRDAGKTVFFSSHILSDVETIADEIAIVARGQIQSQGTPRELVGQSLQGTEIVLRLAADAANSDAERSLAAPARAARRIADELTVTLAAEDDVDAYLALAHGLGAKVVSVVPRHETLEAVFLRQIAGADASGSAREGRV